MTTMIREELLAYPLWTQMSVEDVGDIYLVGPSGGFEVFVSIEVPDLEDQGIPITTSDGVWRWSAFDANETVFARPFGNFQNSRPIVAGIVKILPEA